MRDSVARDIEMAHADILTHQVPPIPKGLGRRSDTDSGSESDGKVSTPSESSLESDDEKEKLPKLEDVFVIEDTDLEDVDLGDDEKPSQVTAPRATLDPGPLKEV